MVRRLYVTLIVAAALIRVAESAQPSLAHGVAAAALMAVVACLSVAPVVNLLSPRQVIAIANGTSVVADERADNPALRAVPYERGGDWQVTY